MKKADFIWISIIVIISSLFVIPDTRLFLLLWTDRYPYLMGFIKTALLASMGEIMAIRIQIGNYQIDRTTWMKFFVWGMLGLLFVMTFQLFSSGVASLQDTGLLPSIEGGFNSILLKAFLTSLLMNVLFAPTFMILHRLTDQYITLGKGRLRQIKKVRLLTVLEQIDWHFFFRFVLFKTIPLFWIPAHTVTFLLPENYRVLMAAYLSIALGIILSFSKKKSRLKNNEESNHE